MGNDYRTRPNSYTFRTGPIAKNPYVSPYLRKVGVRDRANVKKPREDNIVTPRGMSGLRPDLAPPPPQISSHTTSQSCGGWRVSVAFSEMQRRAQTRGVAHLQIPHPAPEPGGLRSGRSKNIVGRSRPRCFSARHPPKSQGPLLRWRYPASTLVRPRPTPAMAVALRNVEDASLARRVSPDYPNHLSDVPCLLPRRIERMLLSIASPLMQPSPNGRRVGIRIVAFAACSGFTHVTAHRIAQPPKVTFVTRLQPSQLPSRAARQLPDLSTSTRVRSSSLMVRALGARGGARAPA